MHKKFTFLTRAELMLDSWFNLGERHDFLDNESFLGLAGECLRQSGVNIPAGDTRQLITRALTSSDFSKLLADVTTKLLQKGFEVQPRTYQHWMEPWPVPDFKDVEVPRIGWPAELPELNPNGGEYDYLAMTDAGETASISTRGGIIKFSRKLLVNDDRGALRERARAGGLLAARTMSRRAYSVLLSPGNLSDSTAFFHSTRGNLLEGDAGTTYALSADALGAAIAALRSQQDDSGSFLDFQPKFLLVPPALELTAWSLCHSGSLLGQDNAGVNNLFREKYGIVPIVSPELGDTELGGNSRDWYLFSDPVITPASFKMLSMGPSWPKPYTDQLVGWRSDNLEFKVRLDFQVAAINPLGCVKISVHSE